MAHGPTPRLWKLSAASMLAIRREYALGYSGLRELARRYGVGYATIHQIVSGQHPGVTGGNLCRSQGTRPNRKVSQ